LKGLIKSLRIVLVAAIAFAVVLAVPAFADDNEITCPENSVVRLYESATGTGSQTGTPTPEHPIEPVFYTQGDMALRAVGDYKDSYDATTGKITRRVGVKVLDGTEDWQSNTTSKFYLTANYMKYADNSPLACTQYKAVPVASTAAVNFGQIALFIGGGSRLVIADDNYTAVEEFKQFLADQARAGTPVVVYYPLAEETTEDWTGEHGTSYCADAIKIASKDYVTSSANADHGFGPLNTLLNTVITTINTLVVNTVNQAATIKDIATTRQTRPDPSGTNGTCPQYKQCLLIKQSDGVSQWFEIFDPVYSFVKSVLQNRINGNNVFFHSDEKLREKTTCDDCGSVYIQGTGLQQREWRVDWQANQNYNLDAGTLYGEGKCIKYWGQINKVASTENQKNALAVDYNDSFYENTQDLDNYRYCWCRVNGVEIGNVKYDKTDSAQWVYSYDGVNGATCAYYCASTCTNGTKKYSVFRDSLLDF